MGALVDWLAPNPVGYQALPCADAASCSLVGSGHKVADCGLLGDPGSSAGLLVGGVRFLKILGRLPTLWPVKPDPGWITHRQS